MSESWLDGITKTRRVLTEMISSRGFTIPPSLGEMSPERMNIMVSLFRQSKGKDRPPTLDIHVVNTDCQVYVAWLREDKLEKDYKSAYKYFIENLSPSENDDLILVVASLSPPTPEAYSFESDNVSVFSIATLSINITKHNLVPKHELLDFQEAKRVMRKLQVNSGQLPQMRRFTEDDSKGDPVARFYGYRPGDIVRITRHSVTSGKHQVFREIVGTAPGPSAISRSVQVSNIDLKEKTPTPVAVQAPACTPQTLPSVNTNLGDTKFLGPNYNFSFHNHPMQLLKSLIQKAIRRNDTDTAIWVAAEVSSFHQLYIELMRVQTQLNCVESDIDTIISKNKTLLDRVVTKADLKEIPNFGKSEWVGWIVNKQKGIMSLLKNFVHRLMVISVEDSFSGWTTTTLDPLFRELLNNPVSENFASQLALTHLYLIESTKIRLTSDIKSVYMLPSKHTASPKQLQSYSQLGQNPASFGIQGSLATQVSLLLRQIRQLPEFFNEDIQEDISRNIFKTRLNYVLQEETEIKIACLGLIESLMESSDHVFYWINRLLIIHDGCRAQPTGKGGKSKQCIYLIWKILKDFIDAVQQAELKLKLTIDQGQLQSLSIAVQTLCSWYFDGNLGSGKSTYELPEAKLFLYFSFLLYTRLSVVNFSLGRKISAPSSSQLTDIRETQDLEIPGYAKDMHVSSFAKKINQRITELKDELSKLPDSKVGTLIQDHYPEINSFTSEETDLVNLGLKVKQDVITRKDIESFLDGEIRNQSHFARVAARVVNEEKSLVDQRYRAIYNGLKGTTTQTQVSASESTVSSPSTGSDSEASETYTKKKKRSRGSRSKKKKSTSKSKSSEN